MEFILCLIVGIGLIFKMFEVDIEMWEHARFDKQREKTIKKYEKKLNRKLYAHEIQDIMSFGEIQTDKVIKEYEKKFHRKLYDHERYYVIVHGKLKKTEKHIMNRIIKILMDKDNMAKNDAQNLYNEVKEQMDEFLEEDNMEGTGRLCMDFFGILPDNLEDIFYY